MCSLFFHGPPFWASPCLWGTAILSPLPFSFSSVSSIQLLLTFFIFPVGHLHSFPSFWYHFNPCPYCQRSHGTFKTFLSESCWSGCQRRFHIWGATFTKSVSPNPIKWLNQEVPELDCSDRKPLGLLWKSFPFVGSVPSLLRQPLLFPLQRAFPSQEYVSVPLLCPPESWFL